jgi:hypothetical protein
MQHS